MLTLVNHYRLCGRPVGNDGWTVLYSSELTNLYEIKLEHEHLSSVKVYLQRQLQETWKGESAYYFKDKDNRPTGVCVTVEWLKDINNLLKTLERFTC